MSSSSGSSVGMRSVGAQSSNSATSDLIVVSSCRCDKINSMFKSFDSERARILSSIGFGGLLRLPLIGNVNEELCLWLYQRVDFRNMCLHLDGGVDLHFAHADVNLVFGIPFKGTSVHSELNHPRAIVTAFRQKLLKRNTSSSLTMCLLEDIMRKDLSGGCTDAEADAFKIACVLFSVCYFLAPETCHEFPFELIQNFIPSVNPGGINWAEHVLSTLDRASYAVVDQVAQRRNKITLFGCSLFLQVFYLDNMNFGPCTPFHSVLPRASAYINQLTAKLVQLDYCGVSDDVLGQFGRTQIREAFDVCYSRGWQAHIDMQNSLQHASQDDYVSCIEIMSHSLQLLDLFDGQVNEFNVSSQNAADQLIQHTKKAYVNLRSMFEGQMKNLLAKAADSIKLRNVNLYYHYKAMDAESSTNISVVLQYDQGSGSSSQIVSSQKKTISGHSNFPVEFNDQMVFHPDVSFENKYRCYLWITDKSLPFDELNRNWIIFSLPKPLSVTGHEVQHCLKLNGSFTVSIMDAIMVLWTFLDMKMFNYYWELDEPHKIWRHFLPASFAEIVKRNGDYLNSNSIKSCFVGDHITYAIQDCQQIIIPVFSYGETWSCYVWDFKLKTITVLDPILMGSSPAKAKQKHEEMVFKLHSALFACKDHFFSGWDIQGCQWKDVYLTDVSHKCTAQNSGLYTVHYARSFYGSKKLAFKIKEPYESNLCVARGEILYYLFTCCDNKGYKAELLMEKLSYYEI